MKKGAASRLDEDTIDQLLFHTIYFLSGTADDGEKEADGHQWVEFNLPPEWESA